VQIALFFNATKGENMKLHEIMESDGLKRKIIDFDSEGRPVTEPYDGEEEQTENEEETSTEETEKTTGTEEPTGEFRCQYCGKVCKSDLGLKAHERSCGKNPNK